MKSPVLLTILFVAAASFAAGCSLHSTATHWNNRVGPDGKPVFIQSSTNIGFNVGIAIPFLGNITLDTMMDEASAAIAKEDGDHLRTIESSSENYWYGFPPFTWIITPVLTTVSVEYQPSAAALQQVRQEQQQEDEKAKLRREAADTGHVVPSEPRGR